MESIHETHSPQFSNEPKPGLVRGILQYWSVIQGVITVIIAVAVFGLSFRDSQTVQAQDTKENTRKIAALEATVEVNKADREKKLEELRKTILTKDVFDAYHGSDVQRMDRIEKLIEQVLTNQNQSLSR